MSTSRRLPPSSRSDRHARRGGGTGGCGRPRSDRRPSARRRPWCRRPRRRRPSRCWPASSSGRRSARAQPPHRGPRPDAQAGRPPRGAAGISATDERRGRAGQLPQPRPDHGRLLAGATHRATHQQADEGADTATNAVSATRCSASATVRVCSGGVKNQFSSRNAATTATSPTAKPRGRRARQPARGTARGWSTTTRRPDAGTEEDREEGQANEDGGPTRGLPPPRNRAHAADHAVGSTWSSAPAAGSAITWTSIPSPGRRITSLITEPLVSWPT